MEIVTTLGQAETSARLLEDGPLLLDCQLQLGRRDLYQRPTRDHTVTNVDQHLLDLAFHFGADCHLFERKKRSHGFDIAADLPQLDLGDADWDRFIRGGGIHLSALGSIPARSAAEQRQDRRGHDCRAAISDLGNAIKYVIFHQTNRIYHWISFSGKCEGLAPPSTQKE